MRAAGRAERTANGGLLFQEPRPADEAASVELLGTVEFTRPKTGVEMAHAVAHRHRLDPSCGVQATWVAESRQGEVVGVLTAAPPLGWIGSIKTLNPEHRSYVAQRIVEAEALSVAPEARGLSGAPDDQDGGRALRRSRVPADAGDDHRWPLTGPWPRTRASPRPHSPNPGYGRTLAAKPAQLVVVMLAAAGHGLAQARDRADLARALAVVSLACSLGVVILAPALTPPDARPRLRAGDRTLRTSAKPVTGSAAGQWPGR